MAKVACQRAEKVVKPEGDSNTNCGGCTWNSPLRKAKEPRGVRVQRKNGNHKNHNSLHQWRCPWCNGYRRRK